MSRKIKPTNNFNNNNNNNNTIQKNIVQEEEKRGNYVVEVEPQLKMLKNDNSYLSKKASFKQDKNAHATYNNKKFN